MPTRSRRRNPDPPQKLGEYLRERDQALAQETLTAAGIDVSAYAEVFVYENYPLVEIFGRPFGRHFTDDDFGPAGLPSIAADIAESTGRVVCYGRPGLWQHIKAKEQGLVHGATPYGEKFVYVPRYYKNKNAVGLAFEKSTLQLRKVMLRSYKEYLLNDVGILRVPKKYRAQVTRLVLDALANDDLGTYLQARELAELVSE
jgi:hypothetical protein